LDIQGELHIWTPSVLKINDKNVHINIDDIEDELLFNTQKSRQIISPIPSPKFEKHKNNYFMPTSNVP